MIKNNILAEENKSYLDTSLTAIPKTFEEELEEQQNVMRAEIYLENLGIKVKTDMYGFYRNTYEILKDFGAYLSKNNK